MNGSLLSDCKLNNANDLWHELMTLFLCITCIQTSMNAGIHLVHSCAETLRAHFSVLVDQDLSFSQTRSHVKVNKKSLRVNKKSDG